MARRPFGASWGPPKVPKWWLPQKMRRDGPMAPKACVFWTHLTLPHQNCILNLTHDTLEPESLWIMPYAGRGNFFRGTRTGRAVFPTSLRTVTVTGRNMACPESATWTRERPSFVGGLVRCDLYSAWGFRLAAYRLNIPLRDPAQGR